MLQKAIKDFKNGWSLYYVWVYQAYHDITAKYKRTVLGTFWIAGTMVITSVSLALIFGALFHQKLQVALPYVMAGILVFGMASYVFYDGAEMFMNSGGIIKNHAYPFTFYAFHTICKSFFMFLHNLVVYWIFMVLIGAFAIPHWSILLAIPVVFLFIFSWGMLAGMLAARFRDMRIMLPYLGQLFSMLTPIFWRTDTLSGPILLAVNLNPIFDIVQIVRMPLLGSMASPVMWELSLIYTALGILLWVLLFSMFRRRIPFWV
ncbi:ABC transporter permease [Asticcacaulis taihuensis]|uniref:ABC transporter permease n=1 Tax=Asticcacaulis taihuensis TaxID=260084 RepID=UPI003F7BAEC9